MKDSLAIIIPAYKGIYLDQTLYSIANQTCKDFVVYIGDDCSPYNIKAIVEKYCSMIKIEYCRFDNNLGACNLVKQWERCIKMSKSEKWIWLFSDDDIMERNCVESFYNTINDSHATYNLYRFNVNVVNNKLQILSTCIFPRIVDSEFLFKNKSKGIVCNFVVEYIFSRKAYDNVGGFQQFDLAWGSDTATWLKLGLDGIYTIENANVYWRNSGENITTNVQHAIMERKMKADIEYLIWAKRFWRVNNRNLDLFVNIIFIRRFAANTLIYPISTVRKISNNYFKGEKCAKLLLPIAYLYSVLLRVKHKL